MVAPFVSSIRNALPAPRYRARLGPRLSVRCMAARAGRPGEIRSQLLLYPVRHQTNLQSPEHPEQLLITKRVGYWNAKNCPKFKRGKLKKLP